MEVIDTLPIWMLAILIFGLRILDVSLGTLRTVAVVQGRLAISVMIGFVEVMVWAIAVSQVITRVQEDPILLLAFAAGFAAGNACGIALERAIGIGEVVVRMIVSNQPEAIAERIRSMGYGLTSFAGQGRDGPRTLMFTSCSRRSLDRVIREAASLDPTIFYTVDRFSHMGRVEPLPHPTGWRAIFKKK
jgi:uncharacterized protein YebE (UPF0316 family)